jgi:hypothetical protein
MKTSASKRKVKATKTVKAQPKGARAKRKAATAANRKRGQMPKAKTQGAVIDTQHPVELEEAAAFVSGLATAKGLKMPKGLDLNAIIALLAKNPELLQVLLPLLLGLLKGSSSPDVGDPGELPLPPVKPPVDKTEPIEPPDGPDAQPGQLIDAFVHTKVVDVMAPGGQVKASNSDDIKAGTGTQSLKQRVRLNTDPSLGGRPYPGNDPTVNGPTFHKQDDDNNGKSPIIEWKWTVDGKEASNSAELEDPFQFGSYEDNGGTTPTLNLKRPVGPGRHEVKAWPFVRAEYNGGVAVSGEANPAVWFCD